jgi:intracellular septation protein
VLAILNEIVWRNFSSSIWAGFKLSLIPLTFCFMAAQIPFIMRNQIDEAPPQA